MSNRDDSKHPKYPFLQSTDPVCLIIKATLRPVADTDRFQPAGFPEVGHVIYDAPRPDGVTEKVCIVDSPASMANHLESVCAAGAGSLNLHEDLAGLPHVVCVTDRQFQTGSDGITVQKDAQHDSAVVSTFTEGHRLASDYFLDALMNPTWTEASTKRTKTKDGKEKEEKIPAHWEGTTFREQLRQDFQIVEVKKDKTYFIPPAKWWEIFKTVFTFDPNSLVHGVMFAKEQIKISRLLTAHLEAFGARRVGRSGVKFDRLGKTTSGQPIFSVDEETAHEIRATFIIDLALLRSYGRGENGLNNDQKGLLLDLALWKIKQLLGRPFRYRTQCCLGCESVRIETELGVLDVAPANAECQKGQAGADGATRTDKAGEKETPDSPVLLRELPALLANVDIKKSIAACSFKSKKPTEVYYAADQLYKTGKDDGEADDDKNEDEPPEETDE